MEDNKLKLGRPVSIDEISVIKKCLNFYKNNGIHNNSFNDVIKHAGVSKGTVYRLFGNEDSLQKKTLVEYYNANVKDRILSLEGPNVTLNKVIIAISSDIIASKSKPCLYYRSRFDKYKLGPKTKSYLKLLDKKVESAYYSLIKKELSNSKKKYTKLQLTNITTFLINNITTLNLLKLNYASHRTLINFAKTLQNYFKNL